jgi:hypothetical protein
MVRKITEGTPSYQYLRVWKKWAPVILVLGAAFWTVLTAGLSAYWTVLQYKESSERFQKGLAADRDKHEKDRAYAEADAAVTRRIEAQKPFLEKRLNTYMEAIKVASRLTELDLTIDSETWKANAKRFWEMRWGELEMVGDPGIRNAARLVGEEIIETVKMPNQDRHNLRWSVECLADELRFSLEHTWGLQKGLKRETVLNQSVSKVPNGCNQGREPAVRPPGMQ